MLVGVVLPVNITLGHFLGATRSVVTSDFTGSGPQESSFSPIFYLSSKQWFFCKWSGNQKVGRGTQTCQSVEITSKTPENISEEYKKALGMFKGPSETNKNLDWFFGKKNTPTVQ